MDLAAIAISVAGAAVWLYRLGALYRRREPTPDATPLPSVSIIVPARDEAHNLPALLDSLSRLVPAPAEVIVVDDHSSDGTGDIARADGAHVVVPPPLPPGWLGKPWACRAGAAAASGNLLLFTDADTVHARDSLARAVNRLRRDGAELVSVVPTHVIRSGWERLQGGFQLLLLVACRAGGRAHGPRDERRFSIGQYLLFTRAAYDRVGRHEAVRGRVAEDLAFARITEATGGRFSLVFAPNLLRVRMYPEGFFAFVRGWRRNFREGMAAAGILGTLEVAAVIGLLLGVPIAFAQAALAGALAPALGWGAAYLAIAADIARRQRALGSFPAATALLYPIFVTVFVAVSTLALYDRARRAPIRWRGRSVQT